MNTERGPWTAERLHELLGQVEPSCVRLGSRRPASAPTSTGRRRSCGGSPVTTSQSSADEQPA